MDVSTILFFSVIIFFAYFVKSITGFAGAVLSVAVLSLFYDLALIVPIITLIDLISGVVLYPKAKHHVNKNVFLFLFVGVVIGTAIGVFFLSATENALLKIIFGVFILLFAFSLIFEKYLVLPSFSPKQGLFFGLLGGVTGGLFSANGPPIAIYLSHALKDKFFLRGTMIVIFLVGAIWRVGLLAVTGFLTSQVLLISAATIPLVWLASYLGEHMHKNMSEQTYRTGVGLLLVVSGVLLLF